MPLFWIPEVFACSFLLVRPLGQIRRNPLNRWARFSSHFTYALIRQDLTWSLWTVEQKAHTQVFDLKEALVFHWFYHTAIIRVHFKSMGAGWTKEVPETAAFTIVIYLRYVSGKSLTTRLRGSAWMLCYCFLACAPKVTFICVLWKFALILSRLCYHR